MMCNDELFDDVD